MTSRTTQSLESYSSLATHDVAAVRTGRPAEMAAQEEFMWNDILAKIQVQPGQRVLDIGVGSGYVAAAWVRLAAEHGINLTFADFPDVIERIRTNIKADAPAMLDQITLAAGIFPDSVPPDILNQRFDRIVLYSVIHCAENPRALIDAAARLLAPGGRLLVGDIPNLDKKGRFLSTDNGRAFDAAYKKVPADSLPRYATYREFTREALANGAPAIDDEFIYSVVKTFRAAGHQAYILEQPSTLPFCFTREDLLICAPAP